MRFIVAAIVFAMMAMPSLAEGFSDAQKKDIGEIAKAYLLEHPEVLQEMVERLKQKEEADASAQQRAALATSSKNIFHNPFDGVVGNAQGDVTVVEFLDYNCGWCKRSIKAVQELVKKDKNLKVVIKEWPIFGYSSEFAAKAAIASAKQGKYWEFHQALFESSLPRSEEDTPATRAAAEAAVEKIAKNSGLDVAKLKTDMKDAAIAENMKNTARLASALKFSGTPGFLINKKVYPGYLDVAAMEQAIAKERETGGCKDC